MKYFLYHLGGQTVEVGHSLVDGLYAISEGELVHDLLARQLEVDLPALLSLGVGQVDPAARLLAEVVEEVLVEAGVLDVVGSHLLLPLDLHTDLQPDAARDGGAVRPFLQVIPDVHLAGERPHLDDGLTEEVVALPGQLLPQPGLQVVVLVPDPDLDPVAGVVALEGELLVPLRIELLGHGLGPLLGLPHLDGHVGVAGPGLVLGDQALGADN